MILNPWTGKVQPYIYIYIHIYVYKSFISFYIHIWYVRWFFGIFAGLSARAFFVCDAGTQGYHEESNVQWYWMATFPIFSGCWSQLDGWCISIDNWKCMVLQYCILKLQKHVIVTFQYIWIPHWLVDISQFQESTETHISMDVSRVFIYSQDLFGHC